MISVESLQSLVLIMQMDLLKRTLVNKNCPQRGVYSERLYILFHSISYIFLAIISCKLFIKIHLTQIKIHISFFFLKRIHVEVLSYSIFTCKHSIEKLHFRSPMIQT